MRLQAEAARQARKRKAARAAKQQRAADEDVAEVSWRPRHSGRARWHSAERRNVRQAQRPHNASTPSVPLLPPLDTAEQMHNYKNVAAAARPGGTASRATTASATARACPS